jgi:glycosyltransferase involved in cell wall biosynthesis
MRVCIVYDCLFPYTVGGGERWYRNLAERLAAEGHEVDYLTLRQWPRGQSGEVGSGVSVVTAGPRMRLYGSDGRRRILPPLVFGVGVLWHLLRHGRRYDVVDTSAFPYFSLLAAALLQPLMGYRLVVDWFEVWSDSYWREYLGRLGWVGSLVQRLCARVPQHAFCFSQMHAQRLHEEGLRGEVTVLRGLYRADSHSETNGPAEPLVLFVGRLIPEKRATLAVAGIAAASHRDPSLRGIVLGDGPDREALSNEIAARGLKATVTAPGFASAEAVERAMGQAQCLLVTSRREGYGMVVVEAAARGTPSVVVAGEDNASTELIEEGINGIVVSSDDPDAIADAILRVRDEGQDMRRSTADWFTRNAHELSLETSLQRVLDAYLADAARS